MKGRDWWQAVQVAGLLAIAIGLSVRFSEVPNNFCATCEAVGLPRWMCCPWL